MNPFYVNEDPSYDVDVMDILDTVDSDDYDIEELGVLVDDEEF